MTEEAGRIGRIDSSTLMITQWNTPSPKSDPRTAIGASGNVYFAEKGIAKIGMSS
jgi:streptogramin lyase